MTMTFFLLPFTSTTHSSFRWRSKLGGVVSWSDTALVNSARTKHWRPSWWRYKRVGNSFEGKKTFPSMKSSCLWVRKYRGLEIIFQTNMMVKAKGKYKRVGTPGDISSELYGDWLRDENFKFCLIFTHFSRFSPFSGYIWWNNTLSSLENFSLNSILFFLVLMSHPDNGGFLKIAQKRDSISKKTSFCIMVINTDHQESWFLSVGHPLCALR